MKKVLSLLLVLAMIMGVFMTAPSAEVKAADTTSGLVAEWKFDGELTEEVNGLNAEDGQKPVTYVDGVFGKAASFNGKDNYLIVKHNDVLNLGSSRETNSNNNQLTISYWAYYRDLADRTQCILDKGQQFGWEKNDDCYWSNPYRVFLYGNCSRLYLNNEFQDTAKEIYTYGGTDISAAVDGNEWKLVTYTYDGSTMKIYADNELLMQNKYSEGFAFNEDNLYIGIDGAEMNSLYKGYLDDLRIYNRCLSYNDIDALYQAGVKANKELVEPTKKMVAYYAFDGNLKDSSDFKNDAEKVEVGGSTKYVIGKNGKAITMSKGNYIRIPAADQLNFDYEFSFSYWLKEGMKNKTSAILYRLSPSMGNTGRVNEASYSISHQNWGDFNNLESYISFLGYNRDSWTTDSGSSVSMSSDKLKASNWNHFTFTYTYDTENDTGMLNAYLNGKLMNKTDAIEYPNVSNADGDLYIGFDNENFFTGAMDELVIYNKCLNATEVKKEYQRVDSITASNAKTIVKDKVITVKVGKTVTIPSITLKDADTKKTSEIKSSDSNVKFTSAKKSIVTVSDKGVLTGKKAGKTTMTITYGGLSVKYTVKVEK